MNSEFTPDKVKAVNSGGNLSSYDWLTEEQRSKIALREANEQNSQQQTTPKRNTLTNSLFSLVPGKNKDKTPTPSSSSLREGENIGEEGGDVSSLPASFTSPLLDNESTTNIMDVNNNGNSNSDGVNGLDRSHIPICYRCNGTVEGPKYSTCKCKVPAMCPEDVKPKKRSLVGSLFFSGSNSNTPDTNIRPGDSSADVTPYNSQHSIGDIYSSFDNRTGSNEES